MGRNRASAAVETRNCYSVGVVLCTWFILVVNAEEMIQEIEER